mmetsp:Transcript_116817/g.337506  ORF Transcript_116817/g.337506 Transcript_116817/m.337506 type:complete len:330 (+) Transcript_116817:1-990(+)
MASTQWPLMLYRGPKSSCWRPPARAAGAPAIPARRSKRRGRRGCAAPPQRHRPALLIRRRHCPAQRRRLPCRSTGPRHRAWPPRRRQASLRPRSAGGFRDPAPGVRPAAATARAPRSARRCRTPRSRTERRWPRLCPRRCLHPPGGGHDQRRGRNNGSRHCCCGRPLCAATARTRWRRPAGPRGPSIAWPRPRPRPRRPRPWRWRLCYGRGAARPLQWPAARARLPIRPEVLGRRPRRSRPHRRTRLATTTPTTNCRPWARARQAVRGATPLSCGGAPALSCRPPPSPMPPFAWPSRARPLPMPPCACCSHPEQHHAPPSPGPPGRALP